MKNRDFNLKAILSMLIFRKMPLEKWRMLFIVGIFLWVGVVGLSSLHAATLCVNPGGTNGCYSLPSLAVAVAAGNAETDVILIYPGTYAESAAITINEAGLKILGDSPVNTIVQNSVLASVFTLSGTADNVEIANLIITGGWHGIALQGGSHGAIIHHNIIRNNGKSGIYGAVVTSNDRSFFAFNNVVHTNNEFGFDANDNDIIYNNIVFNNSKCGIDNGTASYNSSYDNINLGSPLTSNFCGIIGNISNISQNCLFVDETANDYRLQPVSPCKNTGNPGYLDADGTRSDMGSFGGPGAALFWPYGDGGPVVTNLTVDPPYVPEGGNISIKATVEIR